ncbi:MAG: hypothetical protein JRN68_00045 [Nitrososphaerota archaeon]|nr:hypothetical protein [Ferrimicrobium acidiphilum]MDG6933068.1 hypothetical protein [Nitrososphaerota archaeon]
MTATEPSEKLVDQYFAELNRLNKTLSKKPATIWSHRIANVDTFSTDAYITRVQQPLYFISAAYFMEVHMKSPLAKEKIGTPVFTYCGIPGEATTDEKKVTCKSCLAEWKKFLPLDRLL